MVNSSGMRNDLDILRKKSSVNINKGKKVIKEQNDNQENENITDDLRRAIDDGKEYILDIDMIISIIAETLSNKHGLDYDTIYDKLNDKKLEMAIDKAKHLMDDNSEITSVEAAKVVSTYFGVDDESVYNNLT